MISGSCFQFFSNLAPQTKRELSNLWSIFINCFSLQKDLPHYFFIIFIYLFPSHHHTLFWNHNENLMTRNIEEFKFSIPFIFRMFNIVIFMYKWRESPSCVSSFNSYCSGTSKEYNSLSKIKEGLKCLHLILIEKQEVIPLLGELLLLTFNIFQAQKIKELL